MSDSAFVLGPAEFCLVLLRRMADYQPDLADAARRDLGFTRTQMRDVNARWQRMRYAGQGAAWQYSRVLGRPGTRRTVTVGDLECKVADWPLPLWPDLRFEVVRGPGGALLQEWLVRPAGEAAPDLPDDPTQLTPWSCVVADVVHRYVGARHLEGSAPSRWGVEVAGVRAEFVYGLFQVSSP